MLNPIRGVLVSASPNSRDEAWEASSERLRRVHGGRRPGWSGVTNSVRFSVAADNPGSGLPDPGFSAGVGRAPDDLWGEFHAANRTHRAVRVRSHLNVCITYATLPGQQWAR